MKPLANPDSSEVTVRSLTFNQIYVTSRLELLKILLSHRIILVAWEVSLLWTITIPNKLGSVSPYIHKSTRVFSMAQVGLTSHLISITCELGFSHVQSKKHQNCDGLHVKQKKKEKLLAGSGTERVVVAILRLHQLWETWYLQCFWHLGKLKMHVITIITVCFGFCLCFLKEKNMFICFSRFGGSENWKIRNHFFLKMNVILPRFCGIWIRAICFLSFFTWDWVRCQ